MTTMFTIENWATFKNLCDDPHAYRGITFELGTGVYVGPKGTILDFDTVEKLGWDGTLRDVHIPNYVLNVMLPPIDHASGLDVLRQALLSSYAYEDLEENEYSGINDRVTLVLGPARVERLSQICTSERWGPEDMLHCAFNPMLLEQLLNRLDAQED